LTFRTAALRALASILLQAELDAALAEAARLKTMMSDLAKEFQNYKDMTGIATGALEQQQAADAARVAQLAAQAQNDADALARANKMLEDLAKEYAGYKATTSKVIAEWEATSAEDNKRIEALTQRATGETRRADTAEAALKKASDELATLSTRHVDLTAAKAGVDKRASELELTVFKHAAEIDALRKQLQEAADALTAARADAKAYRDASEQTVAALSAQTKRDQEELERSRKAADELGTTLKSLAQEYQVYKIAAEKVRHTPIFKCHQNLRFCSHSLLSPAPHILNNQTFEEAATEKRKMADEVAEKERRIAALEAEIRRWQEELAVSRRRTADVENERDALRKQLQEAMDALAAARADAKAYRETSEQTVAALNAQAKRDQDDLAGARRRTTDVENELEALRKQLAASKAGEAAADARVVELLSLLEQGRAREAERDAQIEVRFNA
jgi:chromosome segregation ATPase